MTSVMCLPHFQGAGTCAVGGALSGQCGAFQARALREPLRRAENPCAPCGAHHWCAGGSDAGARIDVMPHRFCAAIVRRAATETWWGPPPRAAILDPTEEAARAFQRTAGLALAPLRAEVREALYARSHVPNAPRSSWLREGFERAEGARSLRRGVRLELSPGARERPMRSWERGALASAYDGVVVRVREPRHGERAARRIAEARGAAVARRWDAAVKAALPAREDGSARPHALDKALATEGAAALLTAALTGALTAPLEPLARAYGAAVVAVRRAQTGLSDAPCEACLAAARTRLVDALLSRAWGHDLTELDAAALAVERARLTELHAGDVRRAEDEARPRAQACRARRERAALAGESDPGCSCAAGITRTTRKGKGSRKGPKVERR